MRRSVVDVASRTRYRAVQAGLMFLDAIRAPSHVKQVRRLASLNDSLKAPLRRATASFSRCLLQAVEGLLITNCSSLHAEANFGESIFTIRKSLR